MVPYAPRRAQLAPLHVEPVVRMCVRHGSAWRTEAFDAVAAWMPPDAWPPDPALIEDCGFEEAAVVLGRRAMARFRDAQQLVDGFQAHVSGRPHWLLNLVATEPDRRRRGAASEALAPILDRARADGEPCYLETFAERNLGFYARHGFEVIGRAEHARLDLRCWAMWRD